MVSTYAKATRSGFMKRSHAVFNSMKCILDGKRIHRQIAKVRHTEFGKRIHLQHGIPRPDDCRLRADVSRTKPRPGAVRRSTIEWHTDQSYLQLLGVGDVRQPEKCR